MTGSAYVGVAIPTSMTRASVLGDNEIMNGHSSMNQLENNKLRGIGVLARDLRVGRYKETEADCSGTGSKCCIFKHILAKS